MAMARVEVEVVDGTYGQGGRVNHTRGDDGSVPVLKLSVHLDCDVMGDGVVQTDTGRVDHRIGAEVPGVAEDEARVVVVDCASAYEEIDIGMEASYRVFHFGS